MFHVEQLDDILQKARPQLTTYLSLLERWQKAVNLVSSATLSDAWNRHIVDSAQLFPLLPQETKTIIDMGSGAGFPALVLAILTQVCWQDHPLITMVESDTKKCLFLKEVARQVGVSVTILNQRLEKCDTRPSDVITARALAPLDCLLDWASPFLKPTSTCLFLKGEGVEKEIEALTHKVIIEKVQSVTHPKGCILKITEVR
jgi:16S rRNA (guanine527-N7)-methyltransferase